MAMVECDDEVNEILNGVDALEVRDLP